MLATRKLRRGAELNRHEKACEFLNEHLLPTPRKMVRGDKTGIPLRELHPPIRFCGPPPGLLGQRDERIGQEAGICTRTVRITVGDAADYTTILMALSRGFAPRASSFAGRRADLLHFESGKI